MAKSRIAGRMAGLVLMLLAPAAQAQSIGSLIVDPLDPPQPGELAVKNAKPIIRVALRAPYAVRLEEGVTLPPDVASRVSFDPASPFRAGQILTATEQTMGRYCQTIRSSGLGLASACLIDADHDGRFEAVGKSGYNSNIAQGLAISTKGEPVGVRYAKPVPLATPIPYTAVGYQAGPAGWGWLSWGGRAPKVPGGSTRIGFFVNWNAYEGPYTVTVQTDFDGKPLRLDVYGIVIDVLGFTDKGALRVKVDSVRGGEVAPFLYMGRVSPIFIYI